MQPTVLEELEAEHAIIERVLDALERATPETVDAAFFEDVIEFTSTFADGCHHDKEERYLFPLLGLRGIRVEMGPIGVMLEEHTMGRKYVAAMRDLLEAGDLAGLCRGGRAYAALLREHILKEDETLFPMARAVLTDADHAALRAAFDRIHDCEAVHATYAARADALLAATRD